MQEFFIQVTRIAFLLILWLFVWLTIRALRSDIQPIPNATEATPSGPINMPRNSSKKAHYLVVTKGPLAGARIQLGEQPILLGRADESTLVLNDDYASNHHARLVPKDDDWFLEDLGSTNGTFLDRSRVTTAVRIPLGAPIRIGKTVMELRP